MEVLSATRTKLRVVYSLSALNSEGLGTCDTTWIGDCRLELRVQLVFKGRNVLVPVLFGKERQLGCPNSLHPLVTRGVGALELNSARLS